MSDENINDKKNLDDKDEVVFEEEVSDEFSSDPAKLQAKFKKLRQDYKECQSERAEYLAGWQRARADYLNLKKETEKAKEDWIKFAKADLLFDLISLADNFEMAFANKEAWQTAPENWRQGIEYIYNQLQVLLSNNGLLVINRLGEVFDPSQEEAIANSPTSSEQVGRVLEVVKKGYILNGKVLRPAQVKVGTEGVLN